MADLCQDALAFIDQERSTKIYKKGQRVFHVGDEPEGIYCVSHGVVKIEAETLSGKGHLLRMAGPGDFLGYRALFAKEPYEASAVATEEAVVCLIPTRAIEQVIAKYPDFALKFLAKIARDVRQAEGRMVGATDKEAHQRVAESLLFLREQFPEHQWTRKDIAEWAGTTPETVMRTLSQFVKEGWVVLEGRKILLTDRSALLQCAELVV